MKVGVGEKDGERGKREKEKIREEGDDVFVCMCVCDTKRVTEKERRGR